MVRKVKQKEEVEEGTKLLVPSSSTNLDTADDMVKAFQQMQSKNEMAEVLKELFDSKKINLISEFTTDEIGLITQINTIANIKGLSVWESTVKKYAELMLSHKRKSRKEIIDAIKGYNANSMMDKINPRNMFGGRRV